jgi:hypothetical protein
MAEEDFMTFSFVQAPMAEEDFKTFPFIWCRRPKRRPYNCSNPARIPEFVALIQKQAMSGFVALIHKQGMIERGD